MNQTEFNELIALVIENEASPDQVQRLQSALAQDADLLHQARAEIALHAQLGIALESEFSAERFHQQTLLSIKEVDSEEFSQKVVKQLSKRRWNSRLMAVAAVVLFGFIAFFATEQMSPDDLTEPGNQIASLTKSVGVVWSDGSELIRESIVKGQSINIEAGLIEVALDGRGSLIIEGPAHIDFTSAMEAVIHRGNLVMRATQKGHGYTVKTPRGKIIDLGTEFAITVADDQSVETHVIEGSVEAVSNSGKNSILLKNDALRFDTDGSKSIVSDAGRFYTSMPPEHQKAQFIHWSFDEMKSNLAHAIGALGTSNGKQNDLILRAADEGSLPQWITGVKGSAIQFDGLGAYAQSDYRGIEGARPRTVSFWVKTPKDFSIKQGFGIVSWGNLDERGNTWQISINPLEQDGEIGRLRLGLHGGQIVGSTDLRDDQWHHVAVVLYGGSQPNVATHALLYIDGKKETVSRASLQEVKTDTTGNSHGVWVGRNVSYIDDNRTNPYGKFFRGSIDELYIFDAALSQKEIHSLMKTE